MGDVLAADFKAKKYLGNLSKPKPVQTPLEDGLSIIAQAMAEVQRCAECTCENGAAECRWIRPVAGSGIDGLAWPGMDIQAPYMAPEKDPA